MEETEINCYLCGKKAIQEKNYDSTGNLRVECRDCVYYELTIKAVTHYFNETTAEEILSQEDKPKLINHIRRNYNPYTQKPIQLNIDIVKTVTGKV